MGYPWTEWVEDAWLLWGDIAGMGCGVQSDVSGDPGREDRHRHNREWIGSKGWTPDLRRGLRGHFPMGWLPHSCHLRPQTRHRTHSQPVGSGQI